MPLSKEPPCAQADSAAPWETPVMRKKLKGNANDFQMELMDDLWAHLPCHGCTSLERRDSKSSLKYSSLAFGCMLDSKSDPGASGSSLGQTRPEILHPGLPVHCRPWTRRPGFLLTNHAPTKGQVEGPLSGDESICDCCDSQCVPSKLQRAMMEGFSSRVLLVSDQPYTTKMTF
ncbi:hypothetical protein KUCAC02_026133 [Chaenocephalus aceratus]|uniref:Uncharacterized protein n=1 Tax=Chaenocephalus aceratus TaxID=36190 RepID=A0ACB9VXC6_CHAAC|nr:hypothetical protein KUCAC02_026133 [Chaenocephalus aceratus]